jgi:hypothetical protein
MSKGWRAAQVFKMQNHGIQIEQCPRCGKHGLLFERLTVTRNGLKKYTYRKLNVAYYLGNSVSKNGKPVDRIQWRYLNTERARFSSASEVMSTTFRLSEIVWLNNLRIVDL